MTRIAAFLSIGLLACSVAAHPALADKDASRLPAEQATAPFLDALSRSFTVTPRGEGYTARFDIAPLTALIGAPGLSVSLTPLEWTVMPEGGGQWRVTQDQPLSFTASAGGQGVNGRISSMRGSWLYDQTLAAVAVGDMTLTGIEYDQVSSEGGQTTHVSQSVDSFRIQSRTTGTIESANSTTGYSYSGLRQVISVAGGGKDLLGYTLTSPDGVQTATLEGSRTRAVRDVFSWLTRHPSFAEIAAGQAELKPLIRDALPVFTRLSVNSLSNGISINSLYGRFEIAQLGAETEMAGLAPDGSFRQSFSLSGFEPPPGLSPGWAKDLVPEDLQVDVRVSGFDAAGPVNLLLDQVDFSGATRPAPGLENELEAALLPGGVVAVTLAPSSISAGLYRVTAEGRLTAGPKVMPSGEAKITATGLDAAITALSGAPPDAAKAAPLLILAKGLAKPEPDGSLSWKIEAAPGGPILVNGTDIAPLLGVIR